MLIKTKFNNTHKVQEFQLQSKEGAKFASTSNKKQKEQEDLQKENVKNLHFPKLERQT